jgi:crossover junction endodeoxyribonuclease RuvC
MGWGVIKTDGNRHRLLGYGVIGTSPGESLPIRLRAIFSGVNQIIETYLPDSIAFEELFFAKNVTTAMSVGAARGVAMLSAGMKQENLYEYTPMQIKQAVTGYGKADKPQVQEMTRILLGIPEIPKPDDAADALAVAIAHSHCFGSNGVRAQEFRRK